MGFVLYLGLHELVQYVRQTTFVGVTGKMGIVAIVVVAAVVLVVGLVAVVYPSN